MRAERSACDTLFGLPSDVSSEKPRPMPLKRALPAPRPVALRAGAPPAFFATFVARGFDGPPKEKLFFSGCFATERRAGGAFLATFFTTFFATFFTTFFGATRFAAFFGVGREAM